MKRIFFTVTNDLTYDQRMHRICHSLAENGYAVTLIGRKLGHSRPLQIRSFDQKRLKCLFNKGVLFYAEYNLRLFFYLLFKKMDGICAIDLDTILPCLIISKLKSIPRVYDAHEYFTEMKEVISRPAVQRIWLSIERFCLPKFQYGYTVSPGITTLFNQKYKTNFITIRNLPILRKIDHEPHTNRYLFFGGMVNEARGFEVLIPAMRHIPYPLIVAGDGNFMQQLKVLIKQYKVEGKVILMGLVTPEQLRKLAEEATLGLGLAEKEGVNQYLALPNKFFDYLHAGLPQVCMNYPEYAALNKQFEVAVLIDELEESIIIEKINDIMNDEKKISHLRQQCILAKEVLNWEQEENILLKYYYSIFN